MEILKIFFEKNNSEHLRKKWKEDLRRNICCKYFLKKLLIEFPKKFMNEYLEDFMEQIFGEYLKKSMKRCKKLKNEIGNLFVYI